MPPEHDSIADFLGWLGRQVGHITKAVKTDVSALPAADPKPDPVRHRVYRDEQVHEQPHPDQPDLLLRRTVVDEVIVQLPASPPGAGIPPSESKD